MRNGGLEEVSGVGAQAKVEKARRGRSECESEGKIMKATRSEEGRF